MEKSENKQAKIQTGSENDAAPPSLPVHVEVAQLHGHDVHDGRDLDVHLGRHACEVVLHRQQAEVGHDDVGRRGGLRQEDDGRVEVHVEGDARAALGQLHHARGRLLGRLRRGLGQGLLGRLEVVDERLVGGWGGSIKSTGRWREEKKRGVLWKVSRNKYNTIKCIYKKIYLFINKL